MRVFGGNSQVKSIASSGFVSGEKVSVTGRYFFIPFLIYTNYSDIYFTDGTEINQNTAGKLEIIDVGENKTIQSINNRSTTAIISYYANDNDEMLIFYWEDGETPEFGSGLGIDYSDFTREDHFSILQRITSSFKSISRNDTEYLEAIEIAKDLLNNSFETVVKMEKYVSKESLIISVDNNIKQIFSMFDDSYNEKGLYEFAVKLLEMFA